MKNKPDSLFFTRLFVPRTSQISPYPTRETAFAAFSCGFSNVNVLGMEIGMNRKNKEFFFGGEEDEVAVITLNDSDGYPLEVEVLANVEIEEFNKEYIAALPRNASEKYPANNLIILEYTEDAEGNPQFSGVTDQQELRDVSNLFMEYFSS